MDSPSKTSGTPKPGFALLTIDLLKATLAIICLKSWSKLTVLKSWASGSFPVIASLLPTKTIKSSRLNPSATAASLKDRWPGVVGEADIFECAIAFVSTVGPWCLFPFLFFSLKPLASTDIVLNFFGSISEASIACIGPLSVGAPAVLPGVLP